MLGPVRVLRDGSLIEIGGIRAETLLAILAVHAGAPVSADALADELWAGEPPDGAQTTLRSYVSRLRAALGAGASIDRVPAGYVLELAPHAVDIARFEALAREGLELRHRRRHRRAADVLRAALELWRGEPFAGLPREAVLLVEADRLEELRLNVLEARIESDLELGRDADMIDELEGFVARHPFRERLWRQLMLALYRAGRQADALATYHRARGALDEELGIEPGDELRALEAAILRQDVAPPAAVPLAPAIGLPAELTEFVGRARELDEVHALLRRSRLVTLVGVGGVGKTRLALEAARRAARDTVDEVAVVDLAPLTDPSLVQAHVAVALGIREDPSESLDAALERALRSGDVLIVLDNCEHLRPAAAELADRLLRAAPDLRVLATSREILDVPGEAAYPVPPLGLPVVGDDVETVRESEAVRLLIDRATLSRHGLQIDAAAYETAARICRELDGLPLAIELAAARAKALSFDEIATRLQDRLELLVVPRRQTAARHRSLREAMDWSFGLLEPDEQRLLAQLSVFPSGATLPSVAAVCLDGNDTDAEQQIERLVDTSLVMPIGSSRGTRYRLLETVREYANGHLPDAERRALRQRHAEHVRDLAEATSLSLEGVDRAMDFDLARDELPSIRVALRWAEREDPALGLEIACALERFWVTNEPREGMSVFDALVDAPDLPDRLRARGYRCRGGCRYALGMFDLGVEDYERALAIHRQLGQRADQAHVLLRLAMEAQRTGDVTRATALFDEGVAVAGGERYVSDGWLSALFEGELAFASGRHDDALAHLARAAALATAANDRWWEGEALLSLAEYALDLGRLEEGGRAARGGLALAQEIGIRQSTIWGLALLAREAAASGLAGRAGRIWGGIEAEVERGGLVGQWEAQQETIRARVAEMAGPGFHAGVTEGRNLSLDAVIEESLSPP